MSKLPITNADMDTEHLELLYIIVGMQNGTATLENSSVLSYEVKYACAMWLSSPIYVFALEKWKWMFTQEPLHRMYSSIYSFHRLETAFALHWVSK